MGETINQDHKMGNWMFPQLQANLFTNRIKMTINQLVLYHSQWAYTDALLWIIKSPSLVTFANVPCPHKTKASVCLLQNDHVNNGSENSVIYNQLAWNSLLFLQTINLLPLQHMFLQCIWFGNINLFVCLSMVCY